MTKTNSLIKLLLAFWLCLAGVSIVSCGDNGDVIDNPGGNEEPAPEPTPEPEPEPEPAPDESESKAGDDFYMYVNGEWHESMSNASADEIYGHETDMLNANNERLKAVKNSMKEYGQLKRALASLADKKSESEALFEQICDDLVGKIRTKTDAYVAFGRAIRMGLSPLGRLYLGVNNKDFSLGYTIEVEYDGDEEDDDENSSYRRGGLMPDVIATKLYSPYTMGTRAVNSPLESVLQGVGIDSKYYLHDSSFDPYIESLEKMSVKDIIELIKKCAEVYLKLYCADEYVAQLSEGECTTVREWLNENLEDDLGYFTSYYYTQEYITEDLKRQFAEFGAQLKASFRARMENNEWLSPTTLAAALDKLDNMKMYYGTPDKWPEVEALNLEGEVVLADVMKIYEGRTKVIESLMGKNLYEYLPVYYMFVNAGTPLYPYVINAFYGTTTNTCYIMAPIMLDPSYSSDMPESQMYATIGAIIGHEMTHGFDREGAKMDKYGNPNNWWSAEDSAKFDELNHRLAAHYSTFEVIPGTNTNGEQTVEEDVADLGGFLIGYDLWKSQLEQRGITGEELKSAKKEYFTYFAKMYRAIYPMEYIIENLIPDAHSINHIRVNGLVRHVDDWYELYNVTEDKALYLAPEERVKIW